MRGTWLILACVLGLSGLSGGVAVMRKLKAEPAQANRPTTTAQQKEDVRKVGVWQPPSGLEQIPIWPNGAPDMEGISQPAESVLVAETPNAIEGRTSEAVSGFCSFRPH